MSDDIKLVDIEFIGDSSHNMEDILNMKQHLCRVSGDVLTSVIDFGNQPLGNGFLQESDFETEYFYPMVMGFSEESKLFQLTEQPIAEKMFHDHYAFFSSTSKNMKKHFKSLADYLLQSKYLNNKAPFVLELGCNDGILLEHFAKLGIRHLGIEPSLNVAMEANKKGVRTNSVFFSDEIAQEILRDEGLVDVFLAANVMCHIPNILDVVKGIKRILNNNGVVVFEDPYLGDVIEKTSYDQIYDEHVFLFSIMSVSYLFGLFDMEIINAEHLTTHGGSMRYTVAHKGVYEVDKSVDFYANKEHELGLDKISTFMEFSKAVANSKIELINLLNKLKAKGKKIVGYGATSKSTTILNYCNISNDLIDYICDTTPIKQGKYSPGMHIPVVPYDKFTEKYPDYAFIFAWNHMSEIQQKEANYLNSGGKWITHVPFVRVSE